LPGRVAASTTSLACSRQRPGRRRWRCPGLAAYLPRAAGSRRPVDPRRCPGPTPWPGSDAARGTRVRESSPASKGTSGCALPRTSVLSYRTGARARSALACETDRRGWQALSRCITRPRVISGRIRVVVLRELLRLRQRRRLHSSPSTFDRDRLRGLGDVCGGPQRLKKTWLRTPVFLCATGSLGVKNARPRVLAAGSGVEGRGRLEASAKADAPAQRRQELSRHAGLAMRRRRNVSVQKTAWLAHRQNSAQPARHRGARAGHGAMLAVGTPSLAGPAGLQSAPPQPVAVLRGGVARVAAHARQGCNWARVRGSRG